MVLYQSTQKVQVVILKQCKNLEYIRNVKAVKTELMNAIEAARERLGVKSIDTF